MPFLLNFCDLDFSGEIHIELLHIVHFVFITNLHICMCVCVYMHTRVHARFFGFYNFPCHIFRGDDKCREMSCLSEKTTTHYCLVFLLVQKSFKNINDCIFMVVTLQAGLLCVLQK